MTTAILLLKKGFKVKIVTAASIEKFDGTDEYFASPKAGAFWDSPPNSHNQEFEETTYKMLTGIARDPKMRGKAGIRLLPDYVFFPSTKLKKEPWFKNVVENFRYLSPEELAVKTGGNESIRSGYVFTTCCIDTQKYLSFLLTTFRELGGELEYVEQAFSSFDQADSRFAKPFGASIIFNCAGLGARELAGDKSVFPIRGQLAIARYPEAVNALKLNDEGIPEATGSYMIPRDDGTVCIGGVYNRGDWSMAARELDGDGIIERIALIDPVLKEKLQNGTVKIERQSVGLRPGRINGIRVEAEKRKQGRILLVHNYGHGAYGFQTSWGSAFRAICCMEKALYLSKL